MTIRGDHISIWPARESRTRRWVPMLRLAVARSAAPLPACLPDCTGAAARRQLFRGNPGGVDLTGANSGGVDMSVGDLRSPNMSPAALRRADLRGADLRNLNATGANLSDAALIGVDLTCARLDRTNLDLAYPRRVSLHRASLCGATLGTGDTSDVREWASTTGADFREPT